MSSLPSEFSPVQRTTSRLKPKHNEIIRLAFLGYKGQEIADAVGMSKASVYCLLRSRLAIMELERLKQEAELSITNVPARARLARQLESAATKALAVSTGILDDPSLDIKERGRTARHMLDRVVFDKTDEEVEKVSYRDLLRSMNRIETQLGRGTWLLPSANAEDKPTNDGGEDGVDASS